MSIYCNISECVFNAKLEEPHQRMYGRGYVPIGDTGKYLGQCSLGVLRVKANTVHTNQTKHVMPECASFSKDETLLTAMSDEPILSFCNELVSLTITSFDKSNLSVQYLVVPLPK